jgi:hypothetical protein
MNKMLRMGITKEDFDQKVAAKLKAAEGSVCCGNTTFTIRENKQYGIWRYECPRCGWKGEWRAKSDKIGDKVY